MSYENAIKQMKKIENAGYLSKGDSSMKKYDDCKKMYRRSFPEEIMGESYRYLKEKIKNFLIEEKVLFQFHYRGILVFPAKEISKAINESKSYSEMFKKTRNIFSDVPIISVDRFDKDQGLILLLNSTYLDSETIKYVIKDHIDVTVSEYDGYFYEEQICIKSSLCNNIEEERKVIDKLFE